MPPLAKNRLWYWLTVGVCDESNWQHPILVYFCTKIVDSVFRALWLASQSLDILLFTDPPSEQRQTRVSYELEQNGFPVYCRNKQAVPKIHEEGDEVRFGSFNSVFDLNLSMKPVWNSFLFTNTNYVAFDTLFSWHVHKWASN